MVCMCSSMSTSISITTRIRMVVLVMMVVVVVVVVCNQWFHTVSIQLGLTLTCVLRTRKARTQYYVPADKTPPIVAFKRKISSRFAHPKGCLLTPVLLKSV